MFEFTSFLLPTALGHPLDTGEKAMDPLPPDTEERATDPLPPATAAKARHLLAMVVDTDQAAGAAVATRDPLPPAVEATMEDPRLAMAGDPRPAAVEVAMDPPPAPGDNFNVLRAEQWL